MKESVAAETPQAFLERIGKDPRLIAYSAKEFGTPLDLFEGLIVPNELFFIRSYGPILTTIEPDAWRLAVGMSCGPELNSSSVRTSASTGAPGSPTKRESCATVISVGEGMMASTSNEDMDAMFQPRPHGAIAVGPLSANPHQHGGKVNSSHGTRSAS